MEMMEIITVLVNQFSTSPFLFSYSQFVSNNQSKKQVAILLLKRKSKKKLNDLLIEVFFYQYPTYFI
jgi:hypothetical protein